MHSNVAGSFESHVIICLGMFVSLGVLLVSEITGASVSKKDFNKFYIAMFFRWKFRANVTKYIFNR